MLDGNWAGRLYPALPQGATIAFYLEAQDLNEQVAYSPIDPNSPGDDDTASTGFFRLAITATEPSLEISEVVTRNKKYFIIPDSPATPDYVEVRNTGSAPVDLTGVGFSGKLFQDAPRFTFPDGTILPPGGYHLIICDGIPEPFHASFALPPDGGTFYLVRAPSSPASDALGFLDSVVIPRLAKSEALFRLGADGPWTSGVATPGASNILPGNMILRPALDEAGATHLTVAIPTTSGKPWQILTSPDFRTWLPAQSGTGDGIEHSMEIPANLSRAFFRLPAGQ